MMMHIKAVTRSLHSIRKISLPMAVHLSEGGCTATFAYRAFLVKIETVGKKDNFDKKCDLLALAFLLNFSHSSNSSISE